MKYIHSVFMLLALGGLFASCDPDAESFAPGQKTASTSVGAYFTDNYTNGIEKEPGEDPTFQMNLSRIDTVNAATVDIKVLDNDSNVFDVPATATFAAGQKTTTVTVTPKDFKAGITYNLKVELTGDNVDKYSSEPITSDYTFTSIKWEEQGIGYYTENTIASLFGVKKQLIRVDIYMATLPSGVRYRFASPYAAVATAKDENGATTGYVYTDAENIVNANAKFVISMTADGPQLMPSSMGIDFGYGEMSMGSLSGKFGTINDEGDIISFPAKSLYIVLPSDGKYYAAASTIYLTIDAYKRVNAQ